MTEHDDDPLRVDPASPLAAARLREIEDARREAALVLAYVAEAAARSLARIAALRNREK